MKKLLSVSIVALFAISPLVANAEVGDRSDSLTKGNVAAPGASTNIATTSYVKGAHKNLSDKIDLLIDDTATTDGTYVKAAKQVGVNLKALDTAVNTLATSNGGKQAQLVNDLNPADNISNVVKTSVAAAATAADDKMVTEKAVRTAVDNVASDTMTFTNKTFNAEGTGNSITNLQTTNFKTGVVVTTVGATGADTSLPTEKAVRTAIGNVASDAMTLTNKTFDANGTGNSLSNVEVADFASSAVVDSTAGIAAVGSASDSKFVTEKAVASALNTVTTDGATKAGVLSTINHSTASVSGTATVYTTWGDETANGQDSVTINSSGTVAAPGTAHNEYYANYAGSGTDKTTVTNPAVAASN